ncbi:hypothetical protein [Ruixingdingia sedimenti]|uniref:Cell division protein ZapA n=1 Tax=Ruixingdingia sedimenti TaxID=3073604 RepID=A0ABU1FEN7_9RHOB|nr:hypothetical protein [Xinfangfangia sp. LG-4]MDR5655366.1 hypothetical protein [Xinfangfangia sp. LG-4]
MTTMTLEQVIEHLQSEIRELRMQLGGAEFAIAMLGIALADTSPAAAANVAERIRSLPEELRDQPCVVSLLAGLERLFQTQQKPARSPPRLRLVDDPEEED